MGNRPGPPGGDLRGGDSEDLAGWSREDLIARLRRLEECLEADTAPEDSRRMLYELQVHQMELERQNREMAELRAQLEASRDRYVALYETAPVAYLTLSREGMIRNVNLAGSRLLQGGPGGLIGEPLSAFLGAEDAARLEDYLHDLLRTGSPASFEVGLPGGEDGDRTLLLEGSRAVSPRDDEPVVRLVLTDVTETREAEALQRRINRALRALSRVQEATREAESPGELMERVCRFLNEEAGYALAYVGEPVEDAEGTARVVGASGATDYLEEVIGEIRWKEGPQGRGPFGRAVQTGQPVISNSVEMDPSFGPWRERALAYGLNAVVGLPLVEGGRTLGVLGLYAEEANSFDAEEMQWLGQVADELATAWCALLHREHRRRAEEERDRLVEVLEATPDFVGMASADGRVTFWNPGAYKLLGYDPETYQPEHHPLREHHPPWAYEHLRREAFPAAREHGLWRGESAFLSRDGREIPVNQVILAHYDAEGRVQYWSTIAHDLTAFKQQRAELERSRRLMAIGELGSVVAHQLNQPLTAALTYAEGTLHRFDNLQGVPVALREGLEQVLVQVRKAGGIVRDLHNFLRGGSPHFQTLDLNGLVRQLGPRLTTGRESRTPRIRQDLAPDLPAVSADSTLIQECLQNLVNNAVEAMEGEDEPVVEIVTDFRQDGLVEVQVRDSGVGLPEALRENLDRPLYTTKPEGLGLGVAICRSVIEAHGGNLWATSNDPEPGTTFHFTLRSAGVEPETSH
ncbi:MAG: GAF domain-containing protein [Thiohalorhabdus sp.]